MGVAVTGRYGNWTMLGTGLRERHWGPAEGGMLGALAQHVPQHMDRQVPTPLHTFNPRSQLAVVYLPNT